MVDVGELRYQITVDDAYRRQLSRAGTDFRGFGRQIEQTIQTADRSATQLGSSFQDAAERADRAAQDTTQAWRQAGSRAEGSADGVGGAWREAGGRAESAASGIGSAWRQAGSRAEGSADAVGAAWRQAGTEGEQAAVGVANAFQQAMERASGAGENAGATSGGSFVAAFGTRLSALASRAGPIGAVLAGTVGVGTFFGAQIADKVYEGFQIQADRDFAQASFGFNDQQMAQAAAAAGKAYGNAWGESVQDNINTAGTAIQAGLLDGDATAAEMQPVIEQLTFVSSIMGEDIPAVARSAGQWIKTGLVGTSTEAFDLMTAAQQRGLNLSQDLLDTMTEYGTQYRKLGIDGPQALGSIQQLMEGGARDTDIAADALKEFSLRVLDVGNQDVVDAFESLQLNAADTAAEFGKGGDAANEMADTVIDKLNSIKDPVERNRVGLALFGTQWEDLGGAINNLDLSDAKNQMASANSSLDAMAVAGGGAGAAIEAAKNKISMAADEMKVKLAAAFADPMTDASNWVTTHQEEITIFFANAAKSAIGFTAALLDGAGSFMQFASVAVDATTHVVKYGLWPFVKAMEKMGELMSHLPGNAGEMGEKIRDNARDFDDLMTSLTHVGGGMRETGSQMFTLADKIRSGTATLDDYILAQQETAAENDKTAATVQNLVTALAELPANKPITIDAPGGQGVLDLLTQMGAKVSQDNQKHIVVDAPLAPPILDILKQLGIAVVNDNNKTILVTDNGTTNLTKVQVDQLAQSINAIEPVKNIQVTTTFTQNGTLPGGIPTYGGTQQLIPSIPGANPPPPGKASGGPISGPGGPRSDDVPIWASNGEFMMKAAAVEKYGMGFMQAVNAGKFADGGAVDGSTAPAVADPGAATVAVPGMGLGDALGAVADTVTQVKQGELDPAMTEATAGVTEYGLATQEQTAAVQQAWTDTGTAITTAAGSVINPAVAGVGTNLQTVAGTVINPTLTGVGVATQQMGTTVQTAAGTVINPAFQSVGQTVADVHGGTVDPVLAAMRGAVDNTAASFGSGTAAIAAHMNGVREATAAPVRFTIGTVFNDGLVGMWNSVSDLVGTTKMNPYPIGFASGGVLPGYTPGRDVHTFSSPTGGQLALSGGEAIMRPEWTSAVGGPAAVEAMNAAARSGKLGRKPRTDEYRLNPGVENALASGGVVQGGAEITSQIQRTMWDAVRTAFPNVILTSGTRYADVGSGFDNHMGQRALDLAGPMPEIARWIYQMNQTQPVEELIHAPLNGWQNLEGGQPFDFGAGTDADHYDHVHWAMAQMADVAGQLVSMATGGGPAVRKSTGQIVDETMNPLRDAISAKIAGAQFPGLVGGLPQAVFGKMNESMTTKLKDLATKYSGPAVGGGGAKRWRPMIIEALKKQGYPVVDAEVDAWERQIDTESGGDPDIAQQIVDVNGTGEAAGVGLGQMIPGTWAAYRDPSLPDDRRDPWAMINGMVRYGHRRYGDSLLDNIGQGHGYRNGGTIPGQGSGDIVPIWAEPGEEMVRKAMAEKHRPLIKAINSDQVQAFADGGTTGFGGYTGKSEDSMKPKNFYDWAALTAGLGFTAASVVEPYLGMASSKQINLGDLAPTIDTGSNSIPGLMDAVNAVLEPLQKQLEEQTQKLSEHQRTLEQIRDKETNVTVNSDSGPAAMLMGSRGL